MWCASIDASDHPAGGECWPPCECIPEQRQISTSLYIYAPSCRKKDVWFPCPRIVAHLSHEGGEISGWCCNRAVPSEPLRISLQGPRGFSRRSTAAIFWLFALGR